MFSLTTFPGDTFRVKGSWIRSPLDEIEIKIGSKICHSRHLSERYEQDAVVDGKMSPSQSSHAMLHCVVPDLEAGRHSVTVKTKADGFAINNRFHRDIRNFFVSQCLSSCYMDSVDILVHPTIEKLSHHSGSILGGHQVKIYGSGFPSGSEVTHQNTKLKVSSITRTTIEATTAPFLESDMSKLGGVGIMVLNATGANMHKFYGTSRFDMIRSFPVLRVLPTAYFQHGHDTETTAAFWYMHFHEAKTIKVSYHCPLKRRNITQS